MRKIKVFIGSPAEVGEERDIASYVVAELGRMLGQTLEIELEAIRWETHAWPDVGADAQDVINREIQEYDIFVGVMWKRFGEPTKRSSSGTGEEFERAYEFFRKFKRPKIMFYFCKRPFYTTDVKELAQFKKVVEFRRKLEALGVLYWEYQDPLQFERNLREHLVRQFMGASRDDKAVHVPALGHRKQQERRSARSESKTIFFSYVHADRGRVQRIYEDLKLAGHRPWIDVSNLLPGQFWHKEIRKAVQDADIMLVFLSHNTKVKGNFFFEELKFMYERVRRDQAKRARIIPVRLDPVDPLGDLSKYQWVDLFREGGLEQLIAAIESKH